MAPFAESKNRPTFVDYDVESLLIGLSSYGGDDDDESSSSSSNYDNNNNNNQEGNNDNNNNNNEERRHQHKDLEIGDISSSTSTTFQDSFTSTSSFYSSTSSTSTSRRKKSVTFNPQCECAMIPHRSSFTRQERKSMFMTTKEYESFKADARATADLLSEWGCEMRYGDTSTPDHNNNNNLEDDDDICFLGLEGHTTVGRTLRRSLRGRAARIVYENQHDDENKNNKNESTNCFLSGTIAKRNNTATTSSNSGSMASQYAKISQSAISFAWMRALKNTDQIREYLESS